MDCAPSRFSRRVLTVALMLAGISVLAHAQKPAGASRARAANGDGGPATRAYVHPSSIAADARGNIYVTELQSFVVRKVATDGIITTVAGNGKRGFSGDGGAAISARLDSCVSASRPIPQATFTSLRPREKALKEAEFAG